MSDPYGASIKLDKFEAVEASTIRGVGKGIRALAFAIQEQAIENIREVGAIDTGSLRNSIYVETDEVNQRAEALAAALEAGKGKGAKSGKPGDVHAAAPGPDLEPLQARVAPCVEHGIYVEMGVTGSASGDHDGRPFLAPAAQAVGEKAQAAVAAFIAEEIVGGA